MVSYGEETRRQHECSAGIGEKISISANRSGTRLGIFRLQSASLQIQLENMINLLAVQQDTRPLRLSFTGEKE